MTPEVEIGAKGGDIFCFRSQVRSTATFSHYLHVNIIANPDKAYLLAMAVQTAIEWTSANGLLGPGSQPHSSTGAHGKLRKIIMCANQTVTIFGLSF